jgi:large subunit ribosomal protein L23
MATEPKAAAAAEPAVEETAGVKLEPHQVVFRPLVTEKGTDMSENHNQYAFEVNTRATKQDIKAAVEELFDVKVLKVRTQSRHGKARRFRFRAGRTPDWKRAIVTLHPDNKISFY